MELVKWGKWQCEKLENKDEYLHDFVVRKAFLSKQKL